jgi:uncharacterized membrane protein
MIGLSFVYTVMGLGFGAYALLSIRRETMGFAVFWALMATSFLAGDRIGNLGNGILVLALVGVASSEWMRWPRRDDAGLPVVRLIGDKIFLPALIVPAVALLGTFVATGLPQWIDPKQSTLVSLAFGSLLALATCQIWLRHRPLAALEAGRDLMGLVGWSILLPQLLAALGGIFAITGVGRQIGTFVGLVLPQNNPLAAIAVYGGGMALLTVIMGNAFAAFPIMAAAVGVPILIHLHHGNPALIGSVGMLMGFCGTLLSPMAVNFNMVPARLLGLHDRYGVIRAQAPTAIMMLTFNMMLIYFVGLQ